MVTTRTGTDVVRTTVAHDDVQVAAGERGSAARIYKRIGWGLVASDALCIVVALGASYLLRFGFFPLPTDWIIAAVASPFIWVAVFHGFKLHSPQHLSNWEEFSRTISACSVGIVVVVLTSYWSKSSFSRAWVGLTWLFVVILELLVRRAWRWYEARLRGRGKLSFRTLIVGTNREAAQLAYELEDQSRGYLPVGSISVNGGSSVEGRVPVVADLDGLADAINRYQVDCLFVASNALDMTGMTRVAQIARQKGAEVRVAANLPEMLVPRLSVQSIGSFMALSVRPVQLSGMQAVLKRAFDLLVAVPGLLLVGPFLFLIGVAIKLESEGPMFFSQDRVTKNGRVFRMVKFRTMYKDADLMVDDLGVDLTTPFFKLEQDPRLTRAGRVLRRLSLDELPQLWNVVKGDMSLVGPRPLPVDQVEENKDLLSPRLEVQAGMTGWWQVQGRSDLDLRESLRLDIFYIENWSLGLDLYIVLKTAGVVLRKRGAY